MRSNSPKDRTNGEHIQQSQRAGMVDLLRSRGIRDERVLQAMLEIPRHSFVPEALRSKAYGDHALPIGDMQTISQPYMVARMTELLEVDKTSTVLEIGAGSGYQTAVLSAVAGRVYAIERLSELARRAQANIRQLGCYNATVKWFDGTIGWSEHAPYDGILVAAGSPEVPEPLVAQLGVGGKLVIPVGDEETQSLVRLIKTENGIIREEQGSCAFVKLIGRHGWPS
ncbi:MAG TPA: protein-L-isoaspartate(D-aspartate) O-methyltransferase [Blastocatellia bacterium]|jgi:protein-L-isoaspartate(D-aspartate) O-methyltransferase|nr:protein-L-isoaspartate(D-aspartate) O-methyltransferase [Blastocatellia bacterium]